MSGSMVYDYGHNDKICLISNGRATSSETLQDNHLINRVHINILPQHVFRFLCVCVFYCEDLSCAK